MGQNWVTIDAQNVVIGFFPSDIHAEIPENAIEVSDETYRTLLDGMCAGKIMKVIDGEAALEDPPPPTGEQVASINRGQRDARITEAAGVIGALADAIEFGMASKTQGDLYTEWRKYRAELLAVDLTAYPAQWPDKPDAP